MTIHDVTCLRMLINQKTSFQWQLICCTTQTPSDVVKTGVLYLLLHSQFPNVQVDNQIRIDLGQFDNADVIGTCFMSNNLKLVAYLKQQCFLFFNGSPELTKTWSQFLTHYNDTSAAQFIAFAQIQSLSVRNRITIHAFITKQSTTEYRKEVQAVNFQAWMLK